MHLKLLAGAATLSAVWIKAKQLWANVSTIVSPLCEEAEKLAKDGKIDAKDRKALVMKALDLLVEQKKIKINFIERIIISWVVDVVAKKLPDMTVSTEAQGLLADIVKKEEALKLQKGA